MGDEQQQRERKAGPVQRPRAVAADRKAQTTRKLAALLGLVPLPALTQAEVDWVFREKVREAG